MNNREHVRLRQAKKFDCATLAAIYDEYHQPLYRYIYRQVGDVDTARDLTGAVFQRFLQALRQGNGPDEYLRAWLYRAAHNVVIDHYRRQKHRRHLPLGEELLSATDDPVRLAEQQLSAEAVRAALQQLTPDQRQVIALKFLEGMSNHEVAGVLNKPVSAVKSLQHRALAAMQRLLASVREEIKV
ncbi:MAG: sigma-70 family RNA polymerase sigma factor [Anaerolineae bacterium]